MTALVLHCIRKQAGGGAPDSTVLLILDESDYSLAVPVLQFASERNIGAKSSGRVQGSQIPQASNHGYVIQSASAVFAAPNVGNDGVFRQSQDHPRPSIGGLARRFHLHMNGNRPAAVLEQRGNPDLKLTGADGFPDRVLDLPRVAAEGFNSPVDHCLGRVDIVQVEALPVTFLPPAKQRRGKRVFPAQVVPVVDMLAERNHQRAWYWLRSIQLQEECIGGWAAGAAFGSKQLDHDGLERLAGSRGAGGVR